VDKAEQTSDWGADELTDEQLSYAAVDVAHLHALAHKPKKLCDEKGLGAVIDLVHDQATFSAIVRCSWCGHSKAEHTRSANS
jgi:ribonuclease D